MFWMDDKRQYLSKYLFAEWETGVLFCADAAEILSLLPDTCVDITVTSPPYNHLGKNRSRAKGWSSSPGMFAQNKWRQRVTEEDMYADAMDESEYQAWLNQMLQQSLRCTKGLVWLNHKIRYRKNNGIHPLRFLKGNVYSEIIWDRGGSMALNCKRPAPSHEAIYAFGHRHYWDDQANRLMSVWRIAPSVNKGHPCSFPVEIPLKLIKASCPPGGIILDPFFGIGTSGLAALELGRKFVGIEIKERYCRWATEIIESLPDYCIMGEKRIDETEEPGIEAQAEQLEFDL